MQARGILPARSMGIRTLGLGSLWWNRVEDFFYGEPPTRLQHSSLVASLARTNALGGCVGGRRWLHGWQPARNDPIACDEERVVLWASNVAALIGVHKFTPRHEAFEAMWQTQYPTHFAQVKRLLARHQGIKAVTPQEEVENAIERTGAAPIIEDALDASTSDPSSVGAVAACDEAMARLESRAREIASENFKAEMLQLKGISSAAREKATSLGVKMLNKGTPFAVIEKQLILLLCMEGVPKEEAKSMTKHIASIGLELKKVEEHVEKAVETQHEVLSERPAMREYVALSGREVAFDREFSTRAVVCVDPVTCADVLVTFGGRVDGLVVGKRGGEDSEEALLVEVKNRIRDFTPEIPIYEQVQVQTLLFIRGMRRGEHVQAFRTDTKTDISVIPFEWDQELWEGMILPKARDITCALMGMLNDLDRAEAFLAAEKYERERLIEEWICEGAQDKRVV